MSRVKQLAKPWIVMPAIAAIVLGGWVLTQSRGTPTSAAARPSEQVVAATTGTVAQTISAQGTVAAARTEDLRFASAGTVTAVNVKAGQQVAAGDVLAEMDSNELEADLSEAEAALAQAEAKLADDTDAGASSAQLNADRTSVATAEDRLAAAQRALEGAKLVASFDGTVALVNVTVGEELGSGGTGGVSSTGSATGSGRSGAGLGSSTSGQSASGTSGSTPHIQLITPSSFEIVVGIDGNDIDRIAAGQTTTVSLSTSTGNARGLGGGGFPGGGLRGGGLPGGGFGGGGFAGGGGATAPGAAGEATVPTAATVTGTVIEVGAVADASSGVARYPVTIAFEDDSGDYNPGATVDVRITYAEKQDAVLVPALAVSSSAGESTVTVTKDGSKETRPVTTGLSSGNMVEITSGLQAGEEVLVAALTFGGERGQGGPGQRGVGAPGAGAEQ